MFEYIDQKLAIEDGEMYAYLFIKEILNYRLIEMHLCTHFNKLAELEKEHCKFIYPYTLNAGYNQSHVGLGIARYAQLFN